jgi:hypothetical protein
VGNGQFDSACPLFIPLAVLYYCYIIKSHVRQTCLLHLLMDYINMTICVLVVACFSFLAVITHVFGGTKETAFIAPDKNIILLTRCWK